MTSDSSSRAIRFDPFLSRLLNRMPEHIVQSFTDAQLEALRSAMVNPDRHKLDIRLSIPTPFKRFYLVFLAGPERRSKARRVSDGFRLWTPANTLFLALLLSSLIVTLYNGFYLASSLTPKVSADESHPTALPWIKSEQGCTGKYREWQDGFCFDSEHSPDF